MGQTGYRSSPKVHWLLISICLLANGLNSVTGEECPSICSCTEEGVGPFIARCSKLDPSQKFGSKVSRVVIENDNALVLGKNTFENLGLQNVSTIQIKNCTLKKFDAQAFSGLDLLRTLEFISVKQLIFDPDMFNETETLSQLVVRDTDLKFTRKSDYLFDVPLARELVISNCGITELHPESFSRMTNLKVINLASNKLRSLSTEFKNLTELEDVDLSYNLLGEVGPDVFENKNLDVLRLRGNPLTSMAGVVLEDLIELDVSLCKFSKIDSSTFSGFSSIRILNLSGNALRDIAVDSFQDLATLAHLDLSYNALQAPLPEGLLENVSDLGILILSHNPKLESIPENIFNGLGSLFRLDLSVCGLKELGTGLFADLDRLSYLNLGGNALNRLKPGVLNKYITNLDLSHNKFNDLDDINFPSDSRLRKLNLANNYIYSHLSTSSLADLTLLETLDLSSCSLSSLWEAKNAPILESLQTLSVAKNFISVIKKEQLELTPKLMGIDISGNPLECNGTFSATLQWFRDNDVKPTVTRLASQKFDTMHTTSSLTEIEEISPPGWGDVQELICGDREKEPLGLENSDDDFIPGDDWDENNDSPDEEDYSSEHKSTSFPGLDNIVFRQSTILAESNDNYLWSVIIVLFSVVAILFSLSILAACILRWSRQRNSYGARVINTHLHPSIMKRGRSSIYQQLYEDPNHPTTPVMSMKHKNQTQYNFPEGQAGKQFGYITYLSKDFHDTTVIPESV